MVRAKRPQSNDAQAGVVQPDNNTAQAKEQLTPADTGTMQPSTSGTQPNDQIAHMLQMMQKTFNEQLKFQRDQQQFQKEQQKHADLQLLHCGCMLFYINKTKIFSGICNGISISTHTTQGQVLDIRQSPMLMRTRDQKGAIVSYELHIIELPKTTTHQVLVMM